jgi:hypothetical protein
MTDKPFDLTEPLAAKIRSLLFCEWDPCGVNQNADCANEYDEYLPAIHRLAKERRSIEEIAAQLNFVESSYINMTPRKELNRAIAEKIIVVAGELAPR